MFVDKGGTSTSSRRPSTMFGGHPKALRVILVISAGFVFLQALESIRSDEPATELPPITCQRPPRTASSIACSSQCRSSCVATDGLLHYTDEAWEKLVGIFKRQAKNQRHPTSYPSAESGHKWFQNNFEDDFHCAFEERIGRPGDGGKWVCDPQAVRKKDCLVYSLGSCGDFSFEEGVHTAMGCEIHTFDPSNYAGTAPDYVTYHAYGVRGPQSALARDPKYKTLTEIRAELGHTNRKIDILKIDVEGAEFETMIPILLCSPHSSLPQQVLIEIHSRKADNKLRRLFEAFYSAGYVIFHKEPNTIGCAGLCIEYAFLLANMSASC